MTTNVKNLFTRAAKARLEAEQKELMLSIEALNKKLNSIFIVNSFSILTKALNDSLDQLNADLDAGKAPSQLSFDVFSKLSLDETEQQLMIDILQSKTGIQLLHQFNIKFLGGEIHDTDSMEFAVLKVFTMLLSYSWITSIYIQRHLDLNTPFLAEATSKGGNCMPNGIKVAMARARGGNFVCEGVNLGLTSNQIKIANYMHNMFFFDQAEIPACAQEFVNLLVLADGENLKYQFTDFGIFTIKF